MQLSMFKKLTLFALASILFFWGISKLEIVTIFSETTKEIVLPNSSKIMKGPDQSISTPNKIENEVSGAIKLMAVANVESGLKVFRKCKSCHTIQVDGRNKIGPNLWNIIDRPKASIANYRYSKALRKKGGVWNYNELNKFLINPKKFVEGNKMSFAGIKSNQDRANLIIFLRSLSDQPKQLP